MKNSARKILLPVLVITGFVTIAWVIFANPPQAKRDFAVPTPVVSVETQRLQIIDFPMTIQSYGNVRPRTKSNLVAQAAGQIIRINPNFREGGFFEKNDTLIYLDKRDYEVEINIAQANLVSAKQLLAEEQARSVQAKQDWAKLGNGEAPSALVLRQPQLLAAESKVLSAEASLSKAKLALERTEIKAPFAGRILKKNVDIGQVVSNSTNLAEIYATDYIEIRLPLKNSDLSFLTLPENYRFNLQSANDLPKVTVTSSLGKRQNWQGNIVRTEGAFDANSQQLYVVAQIDDPYGQSQLTKEPLKIGEYVTAEITGDVAKDVIVIPNKTIYQGSYVYLVKDGILLRREIEIAWQNSDIAIVANGLSALDELVLTPLGQVNSGTKVEVVSRDGQELTSQLIPTNSYGDNKRKNPDMNKEQRSKKDKEKVKNSGGDTL